MSFVTEPAPNVRFERSMQCMDQQELFYEVLRTTPDCMVTPFWKVSELSQHGIGCDISQLDRAKLPKSYSCPTVDVQYSPQGAGIYFMTDSTRPQMHAKSVQSFTKHLELMLKQAPIHVERIEQQVQSHLSTFDVSPPVYPAVVNFDLTDYMDNVDSLLKVQDLNDPLRQTLRNAESHLRGYDLCETSIGIAGRVSSWKQEYLHLTKCCYLHIGSAPKVYLGFRQQDHSTVLAYMNTNLNRMCESPFLHQNIIFTSEALAQMNVPLVYLVQMPGELVYTMPGACYQEIDIGYNLANVTRMWTPGVLPLVSECAACSCIERLDKFCPFELTVVDREFLKLEHEMYLTIYKFEDTSARDIDDPNVAKAVEALKARFPKKIGSKFSGSKRIRLSEVSAAPVFEQNGSETDDSMTSSSRLSPFGPVGNDEMHAEGDLSERPSIALDSDGAIPSLLRELVDRVENDESGGPLHVDKVVPIKMSSSQIDDRIEHAILNTEGANVEEARSLHRYLTPSPIFDVNSSMESLTCKRSQETQVVDNEVDVRNNRCIESPVMQTLIGRSSDFQYDDFIFQHTRRYSSSSFGSASSCSMNPTERDMTFKVIGVSDQESTFHLGSEESDGRQHAETNEELSSGDVCRAASSSLPFLPSVVDESSNGSMQISNDQIVIQQLINEMLGQFDNDLPMSTLLDCSSMKDVVRRFHRIDTSPLLVALAQAPPETQNVATNELPLAALNVNNVDDEALCEPSGLEPAMHAEGRIVEHADDLCGDEYVEFGNPLETPNRSTRNTPTYDSDEDSLELNDSVEHQRKGRFSACSVEPVDCDAPRMRTSARLQKQKKAKPTSEPRVPRKQGPGRPKRIAINAERMCGLRSLKAAVPSDSSAIKRALTISKKKAQRQEKDKELTRIRSQQYANRQAAIGKKRVYATDTLTVFFRRKVEGITRRLNTVQRQLALTPKHSAQYNLLIAEQEDDIAERADIIMTRKLLRTFINFVHGRREIVANRLNFGYTERRMIAHYVMYPDPLVREWFSHCMLKAGLSTEYVDNVMATQASFDAEFKVNRNGRIPVEEITYLLKKELFVNAWDSD